MSFRDFTPRQPQHQQQHGNHTPFKKGSLRRTTSNTCTSSRSTSLLLSSNQQHPSQQPQQQQQPQRLEDALPFTRSRSDLISYDNYYYRNTTTTTTPTHTTTPTTTTTTTSADDDVLCSTTRQLIQQREEEYALKVMQQREHELLDINRKMHVVDEIYKDLGEIVGGQQQETIDALENQFEKVEMSTRRGLEQLEKANKKYNDRTKQQQQERTRTIGGGDDNDDTGNDDEGLPDKKEQFFMFAYLSKKASEIARLLSACGGTTSVDYVHGECCKNP